eukprot:gnl/TRDRNA2_/TRDRNA2_142568_c0_seq1.p1 gnl/TRDRNA2_/TRDRNA2_142568_c0~~gnl/TRDRNA2_/TRDRNA2_142568_c0_seq1.p1  ORF type:complete len:342 (-),score=86.95 gnl/TRDRNA2_/TRDRNA2_142568_c0_seq1:26-1051(-)
MRGNSRVGCKLPSVLRGALCVAVLRSRTGRAAAAPWQEHVFLLEQIDQLPTTAVGLQGELVKRAQEESLGLRPLHLDGTALLKSGHLSSDIGCDPASAPVHASSFVLRLRGGKSSKGAGEENSRGAKAKEQKAAAQAAKVAAQNAKDKAAEDESWAQGSNAKGAAKAKAAEEKEAAKAAAKAAKLAAQAEDEAGIAAMKVSAGKARKEQAKLGAKVKMADLPDLDPPAPKPDDDRGIKFNQAESIFKTQNTNRLRGHQDASGISATGMDEALSALDIGGKGTEAHPERRAKAAYEAFQARMLPQLKDENPSLKRSQLLERCWSLWQKSPENPFNQNPKPAR